MAKKSRTKWDAPMIAKLKQYVNQYGQEIGCSLLAKELKMNPVAVESSYKRLVLYGKNKTKSYTPKTFAVKEDHVATSNNPFEIKTDLEFTGNRSDMALLTALQDQVVKLDPNDRRQSVNIPLTVCSTRNTAANLVLTLRRNMEQSRDAVVKKMIITSRAILSLDGKKSYLGSRIWRVK